MPRGQQRSTYLRKLRWPSVVSSVVFVVVGVLGLSGKPAVGPEQVESDLEVFVRQGCPHCEKAKTYLTDLKQRYPQLKVTVRDIGQDPQALLRLKTLAAKFDITQLGVPAFYVRGELVVGFQSAEITGKQLEELLGRPPPDAGTSSEGTCPLESEVPCPPASTQEDVGGKSIQVPFLAIRLFPNSAYRFLHFSLDSLMVSIPVQCGYCCFYWPCWPTCGIDVRCFSWPGRSSWSAESCILRSWRRG